MIDQQAEMLAVLRAAFAVATDPRPSALASSEATQHYVHRDRLHRLLWALGEMSSLTDEARARVRVRLDAIAAGDAREWSCWSRYRAGNRA